ncbi:hypothetical protein [Pseudomonas sp. B21-048]|uniref:hypothetical protein n=1 Tax=Pseudomonas sp. B21-048 TaxID=2895490 RepID=UPI00215F7DAA|nr:hypothetical protein [Pseudomonas sp. B21-048]UVK96940.1 hypothetical protein LOY56_16310 [Pseudomonas sp. B21-048]
MPIIYKAVKDTLEAVNYGIAIGTGEKGWSDMASDFFGNVVSDAIAGGVNQLNTTMYWSPYASVPNVGNVYSLPSVVVDGSTMYSFYQGQALYTSTGGTGGYPYYTARIYGTVGADQLCEMTPSPPPPPVQGPSVAPTAISAVMFGGKVYAFYGGAPGNVGQTGQIWYTTFDGTAWSQLTLLPDVNTTLMADAGAYTGLEVSTGGGTCGAYPVVFTPPDAQTEQLFVFYPKAGSGVQYSSDIGCVATVDGQTWVDIAPEGLGAAVGEISVALSPIVYAAPGASSEQIYIFYTASWASTESGYSQSSYIVYPDQTGGFSAPVTVPNVPLGVYTTNAIVQTPSNATDPLVYLFFEMRNDAGNWDISYTTFDGNTWTSPVPLPSVSTLDGRYGTTLAVFPPESFNNTLTAVPNIYFSTVNSPGSSSPGDTITAAFVSSLGEDACPISQATPFPPEDEWVQYQNTGVFGAFLLAVDLPGFAAPQPWLFYLSYTPNSSEFQYAVYEGGKWTSGNSLPTPVSETVPSTAPPFVASTGSPAVLPVSIDNPGIPSGAIVAFNSSQGMFASGGGPVGWNFPSEPTPIPGVIASGSPSMAFYDSQVFLFYQDFESSGLYCTKCADPMPAGSMEWSEPFVLSDALLSGSPSAVVFNSDLYVFYQGGGDCGTLWYSCLSGSNGTWSGPTQVIPGGLMSSSVIMSGSPSACVVTDSSGNSQLFVVYAGADTGSGMPLMYCTLGADGTTWTQAAVSGIFVTDSPSAYAVSDTGKLNVFFQLASNPGELLYCVYDSDHSLWSPMGTTTVTTLDGWVSAMMYLDDNNDAWLYLYHNNSGANVGQIGYCVSSVMSTAQGSLFEGAVTIYNTDGTPEYYPAMIGAPSATIANGNICLFYNGTSLEDTGYVGGTLSYMQIPLPSSDSEDPGLGYHSATAVVVGYDDMTQIGGYVTVANSPAAATLQGVPYVFYNTGSNEVAYSAFTDPASVSVQTLPGSLASNCSPAAVVCNDALYVFWVGAGNNNQGSLQCQYTIDGASWAALDLSPCPMVNTLGVIASVCNGQIYLFYSQNDLNYYTIFPQVTSPTAETVTLSPATPISRMNCSTGPSVAIFNNDLWCFSQGVQVPGFTEKNGWQINATGSPFYCHTPDSKCWTWNTGITPSGEGATILPNAVPMATAFSSSATGNLLYVFWPDSTNQIRYVTTDGTYYAPSSSAYGLEWSGLQTISGATTMSNVSVASMPPLDSAGDPDQLYVFWQGNDSAGVLYYSMMGSSGWSAPSQIIPAGCSIPFMTQSPSVVSYAPEGATAQAYVFYQKNGSSGSQSDRPNTYLEYCVYSGGEWSQSQVPVSYTTPSTTTTGLQVSQTTFHGIDSATPPQAIVFNGELYVFYIQQTTEWSENNHEWVNLRPVSYSKYDGASWSSPVNIFSTAPCNSNSMPIVWPQVAQFVYPVVSDGILYVYYMNVGGPNETSVPPGGIYYISTANGNSWSSPAATTNVLYVPGGSTTLSTGTEINDTLAAVNGALQFIGLPTTSDIRNDIAKGMFF